MPKLNIGKVLADLVGMGTDSIRSAHDLSKEQEFAVRQYSRGLSNASIASRLTKLRPGMKGAEIRKVMRE